MPLLLFNKPYGVLSQFTDGPTRPGLARLVDVPGVYPAGRLDADSEGLLLLTDDGALQARISHPRHKLPKSYLAQVEGRISRDQLLQLVAGVALRDGPARAIAAREVAAPRWLWAREPPVRHRLTVPDSWLELVLDEGRNRQVRRMTAAVGLPTLRLLRTSIGPWALDGLRPGETRQLALPQAWRALKAAPAPPARSRPGR
ncbi:MAG: pseudouridine synthase [Gammaproteobacteria bacterium]|nr:pseudouridine synthase [Gammaproteobacteria bacterium]